MTFMFRALLSVAIASAPALLQAQMQIPETFTNLQVLPKDIARDELVRTMRSFSIALGVRCNACHVAGAEGGGERMNFAADDREEKRVARGMLRMMMDINGKYFPEMGRPLTPQTRVTCTTCHRGATRPRTLAAELLAAADGKGIDSAVVRYRELREKTYGRSMFDFGEQSLPLIAADLANAQRPNDAIRLLELNLEFFPKSGQSIAALAQAHAQKGDTAAAISTVTKGLEADPGNGQLEGLLSRLKGEGRRRPQ